MLHYSSKIRMKRRGTDKTKTKTNQCIIFVGGKHQNQNEISSHKGTGIAS